MPKFYIQTSTLRDIIDAKNYLEVIKKFFIRQKPITTTKVLGKNIFISEHGFRETDDNKIYNGVPESIERHKKNIFIFDNDISNNPGRRPHENMLIPTGVLLDEMGQDLLELERQDKPKDNKDFLDGFYKSDGN